MARANKSLKNNPFAQFKKLNGLRLKEIQDYLGVSYEYVSKMSSGARPMTDDIRARLIGNDRGWEITPLASEDEASVMNLQASVLNAKLARENRELRARVLALEKDKANYWKLIEKLSANLKTE